MYCKIVPLHKERGIWNKYWFNRYNKTFVYFKKSNDLLLTKEINKQTNKQKMYGKFSTLHSHFSENIFSCGFFLRLKFDLMSIHRCKHKSPCKEEKLIWSTACMNKLVLKV